MLGFPIHYSQGLRLVTSGLPTLGFYCICLQGGLGVFLLVIPTRCCVVWIVVAATAVVTAVVVWETEVRQHTRDNAGSSGCGGRNGSTSSSEVLVVV